MEAKERKQLGPFVDEVDSDYAPKVLEAFERMAKLEEPSSVVRFLNESGVPRYGGLDGPVKGPWDERALIAMVRDKTYIGLEEHGKTSVVRKLRTGKAKQKRNEKPTRSRPMPHLRIVPDAVFLRANRAIDKRTRSNANRKRGEDHPLWGIPRNSRTELSNLFDCGICGNKMYADGRNEGGYRCSVCKKGGCWNRATALRNITHGQLSIAISGALLSHEGTMEEEIVRVRELCRDTSSLTLKERDLRKTIAELKGQIESLESAIEKTQKEFHGGLPDRYALRQAELIQANADLTELRQIMSGPRNLPTPEEGRTALRTAAQRLLTLDRDVRWLLQNLLVGSIKAVPFQQVGCNKVVLRARLTLQLLPLLPSELQAVLAEPQGRPCPAFTKIDLLVNLFETPKFITHLVRVVDAHRAFPDESRKQLGERLNVNHQLVQDAIVLHRNMQSLGVTDPYVELKKPPAAASRWRPRSA